MKVLFSLALFTGAHAQMCPWGGKVPRGGYLDIGDEPLAEAVISNTVTQEVVGPCTCGIKPGMLEIQSLDFFGIPATYLLGVPARVGGRYLHVTDTYSGCGGYDDVADDLENFHASDTCATQSESMEIGGYTCMKCAIGSTYVRFVGSFSYWTIGCDCDGDMCSVEMLKTVMHESAALPETSSLAATPAGSGPLPVTAVVLVSLVCTVVLLKMRWPRRSVSLATDTYLQA